jgi:hypothetical protein
MSQAPVYPLTVRFPDGDEWKLDNQMEVETSLEWMETDAPGEQALVRDALGRSVRLLVRAHELLVCELKSESAQ